jgi:hypothetical protein
MPYLIAAVVLVGLLCSVDLVLTLGVIRRLRHHTDLLAGQSDREPPGSDEVVLLTDGERPADFTAVTTDGEAVSLQSLHGETLVGFFSPQCSACKERVPEFLEHTGTPQPGSNRALAVVVGDGADADDLAQTLSITARVVRQQPGDPLLKAFKVQGFPALCVLDDGTIRAVGTSFDQIRHRVAA